MNRTQLRGFHAFAVKAMGELLMKYGEVYVRVINDHHDFIFTSEFNKNMRITTIFEELSRIHDNTILETISFLDDNSCIVYLKEVHDDEIEGKE